MSTAPTLPIEPTPGFQPAPARRRARRWPWVLLIVIVLLAVAVVVADIALRAYAEGRAAEEISAQLPENIEGDIDVTIGGTSFLAQVLAGSLERVDLDAPQLTANGIPLAAHVVATGVPTDLSKPIADVTATVTLDQTAVDEVAQLPGDATLKLGDAGQVSFDGTVSLFGFSLGYTVAGTVEGSGTEVTVVPVSATLTQGAGSLDIDLDQLLGTVADSPIPLCVAEYLPQGAEIDDIAIDGGEATVQLSAQDFVADEQGLSTFGTCS
ncbi:LmeA family phospholipid-binding protein [Herbiconiux liukaitaii]|uniref:LmeA family phospholipid-binding protein n=1 Tax=Herbiconiux liukaitaii TaxID=3342799 RepID=UPI0035B862BB